MGASMLIGSVLVAFGPSAAFLKEVVSKRSHLVIIAITAAFFWLVSMLLSSIFFVAFDSINDFPHIITIVISVCIQEAVRALYVTAYTRAEKKIAALADISHIPFTDFSAALAAGYGMGLMYALVMYGGILSASSFEGDFYPEKCFDMSIFPLTAYAALLFQLLHVSLSIVMFDAVRGGEVSKLRIGICVTFHMLATVSTYMNKVVGCTLGMPMLSVFAIGSAVYALRRVQSDDYFAGGPDGNGVKVQ